jgi:mRNA-degrading endonuclease HigB of HigAB toxin-antitoxin module
MMRHILVDHAWELCRGKRNLNEIRKTYSHADGVPIEKGNAYTVFNIGGNHFRLVTEISYETGHIHIYATCLNTTNTTGGNGRYESAR